MSKKQLTPPVANREEHITHIHGEKLVDPYFWMRLSDEQKNASNPDLPTQKVIKYLEEENDFLKTSLKETDALQEDLFQEMFGRIKQDDESVPYFQNGYYYISKFEEGKEYAIYSRKKDSLKNLSELLLDENELAGDKAYYQVSSLSISPNNQMMAYGDDDTGRRIYTIRFKNLSTGKMEKDLIPNTTGHAVWADDNRTVFYTVKDEKLRSYKVFRHQLGSNYKDDVEIFHEKDEAFRTFVFKSKSRKYIIIGSASTLSNEYRYLQADKAHSNFKIFQERKEKLEYGISHYQDKWFIRTNLKAENFKVMSCPETRTTLEYWDDYIPHREEVLVESFDIFENFFVVNERINGITELRVIDNKGDSHIIGLPEEAHMVYPGRNPEFNTNTLRFNYSSMTTPMSVFDYDMENRSMELKKEQEVKGGYEKENYLSQRISIKARDGKMVPISIVHHSNTRLDGNAPILLYAYGSYGISLDPYFSIARLSLLDRGFVYAIAHIRGGEELGRQWYEDGKMLNKKNTFRDFIDSAQALIELKIASPQKIYAMGGSAGGLLMGAIANMKPELWAGILAAVPFVDVINTMLDESIPLTTGEFNEWGNPKDKEYFDYIRSYSPYDNVDKKEYPPMLITTGYHDSQVQYWEPAKWLAKLRYLNPDSKPIFLHCDMETGHGGASGRFKRLREVALEYAFLIWLENNQGRAIIE